MDILKPKFMPRMTAKKIPKAIRSQNKTSKILIIWQLFQLLHNKHGQHLPTIVPTFLSSHRLHRTLLNISPPPSILKHYHHIPIFNRMITTTTIIIIIIMYIMRLFIMFEINSKFG